MEVSSWETHNSLEHFQHAVRKKNASDAIGIPVDDRLPIRCHGGQQEKHHQKTGSGKPFSYGHGYQL